MGWPEGMAQGQGRWGDCSDRELAIEPMITARQRGAEWRVA